MNIIDGGLKVYVIRKIQAVMLAAIVLMAYPAGCFGQTLFKEKIHFNVGAGYGNYNLKRGHILRGFVDDFVYVDSDRKRIEGGREYYGEMIFDYSAELSFGSGILYSGGREDLAEWYTGFLDDYNRPRPRPEIYETSLIAPYMKASYRSKMEMLNFAATGNLYYGFGKLSTNFLISGFPEEYEIYNFRSDGFGYALALGISVSFARGFALVNEFGYRNLVMGQLRESNGYRLENFELNFSGYFIRGGISINPWGK